MVYPVSRSIFDERVSVTNVNAIVQTKKNAQAGLDKDCVCRLENNVIAGDIPA
jgi:hypothetical protein